MANVRDKEELLSALFVGYVVPKLQDIALQGTSRSSDMDTQRRAIIKLRAMERYMRTFLRSLTIGELEDEVEQVERQQLLSAELMSKMEQASRGFDRFVAKKYGKVAV